MKTPLGLFAAAVLVVLSACGDGSPGGSSAPVAFVRVQAPADSVTVGQQLQLTATALDASGVELSGRPITWSSSNTSFATVSTSGAVLGLLRGDVTITATSGSASGAIQLRVRPVPVASVTVTPAADTLRVGESVQLIATARDAAGNVLTGRPPVWTTSNAAIVQVSAAGMVTALAPGEATVRAGVDGTIATAVITVATVPVATVEIFPSEPVVILAGEAAFLTAVARGADRGVLSGRPVQWSSANEAVATVSAAGVVTGVSAGTTSVTATVEGKTAQVPVIIRIPGQDAAAPEITSFSVQPQTVDVSGGPGTFTFTFAARDYGSGVTNVFVSLNYPANPGSVPGCAGTRVGGTQYEGTWSCTITFPRNSPSRTWQVDYISAQDVEGNRVQLSNAAVAARGWPSQVTVTGAAPDEAAPTLASFSFTPATVNVANGPGSVTFTIAGRDVGGTGISGVFVSLNYPNNPGATRSCSSSQPASGTRTDGVFQCTVIFPQGSPARTWNVEYISLTDQVGNVYRPFQGELQSRGYATTVQVTS